MLLPLRFFRLFKGNPLHNSSRLLKQILVLKLKQTERQQKSLQNQPFLRWRCYSFFIKKLFYFFTNTFAATLELIKLFLKITLKFSRFFLKTYWFQFFHFFSGLNFLFIGHFFISSKPLGLPLISLLIVTISRGVPVNLTFFYCPWRKVFFP